MKKEKELSKGSVESVSGGIDWGSPIKVINIEKGQTISEVLGANNLDSRYESQLKESDIFNGDGEAQKSGRIYVKL